MLKQRAELDVVFHALADPSRRSIEHAGFTIERCYGAAPERVFAAWADPAAKARWFASVSLVTVEPAPDGDGTRLTFTEDSAFFDGLEDPAVRRDGTGSLLDALARELERDP